jgi:D-alanyl-D-alanine carboxypeptidase
MLLKIIRITILASSLLFTPAIAQAATFTNTADRDLRQQLQTALDQARGDIPGAAVAIISPKGNWFGASGVADLATGRVLQPSDRFQIGSITKTFVATTTLQLVEEGILNLDDKLTDRLPTSVTEWIPNANQITLRQLLNHTSGVPDYTDVLFRWAAVNPGVFFNNWQPQELVSFIDGLEASFQPGDSWQYSNTNYLLLGMVVETATNNNIAQEIRDRILEPLALTNTFFA